jgi:hypothetical protein
MKQHIIILVILFVIAALIAFREVTQYGPGSYWFWRGLAFFIAIGYSIIKYFLNK